MQIIFMLKYFWEMWEKVSYEWVYDWIREYPTIGWIVIISIRKPNYRNEIWNYLRFLENINQIFGKKRLTK